MTEVPVLFATFARPEYARQTFDAIKRAQPKKIYFYSNKARENNPEEIKNNNIVRALINEIDWECNLKTFFRDEYVDIYTSLWGAYDWFFNMEEQGIILEEDCVPSLDFFSFCEQLLPLFKDDIRIWLLSGNNLIEGYNPGGYDYIFSRYAYQYGWASWRSRWAQLKRSGIPLDEMLKYELFKQLYINKGEVNYQINHAKKNYKSNAWDFVLGLTIKCNGGFGVVPTRNLVKNIGINGAHNKGNKSKFHLDTLSDEETYLIKNPPPFVIPDYKYEREFYNRIYKTNVYKRLRKKVKTLYGKLRESFK